MNMKKKVISLALIVAMLFSTQAICAFAAEGSTTAQKPVLRTVLEDSQYTVGETATALEAAGEASDHGYLDLRWQTKAHGAADNAWTDIAGTEVRGKGRVTGSYVPATNAEGTFDYRYVVTNTVYGSNNQPVTAEAVSNVATITVRDTRYTVDVVTPFVQCEPGANKTLNVTASQVEDYTTVYQWYTRTSPNGSWTSLGSNGYYDNGVYILDTSSNGETFYYVEVTWKDGNTDIATRSSSIMTVQVAPSIQPLTVAIDYMEDALTGLEPNSCYRIESEEGSTEGQILGQGTTDADGNLPVQEVWIAGYVSIYKMNQLAGAGIYQAGPKAYLTLEKPEAPVCFDFYPWSGKFYVGEKNGPIATISGETERLKEFRRLYSGGGLAEDAFMASGIEEYRWQYQNADGTWVDIDTWEYNKLMFPDIMWDFYRVPMYTSFSRLHVVTHNGAQTGTYRCIASTGDAVTLGEPVEAVIGQAEVIHESVNNSV